MRQICKHNISKPRKIIYLALHLKELEKEQSPKSVGKKHVKDRKVGRMGRGSQLDNSGWYLDLWWWA